MAPNAFPVASLAVVLLLAAGCLDDATLSTASPTPTDEVVSASTGAIEVVAVTSEAIPVSGAQVVLRELDLTVTTDETGVVTFPALEPGRYTLLVAKAGYRAMLPQGVVVTVQAGEVTSAKLVLEPVPVVSAATSYHKTLLFRGFISCSVEWIKVATLVNRSQCGKGVNVGGQTIGADPNENATHVWMIENNQIQTIIMEGEWRPSIDAIGGELYFATHNSYTCTASSCQYNNEIVGRGGRSPVYASVSEGSARNLTGFYISAYGGKGEVFPQKAWSIARTYCGGCVVSVTFQQGYELAVSAFYGLEAPPGWKNRPA